MEQNHDHAYVTLSKDAGSIQEPCTAKAKKRKLCYSNALDLTQPVTAEFIDVVFQYIEDFCKNVVNSSPESGSIALKDRFNTMILALGSAKCLEDIVNACDSLEIAYEKDVYGQLLSIKGIVCKSCAGTKGKFGTFEITGEDRFGIRSRNKTQAQRFRSMKTAISEHLQNIKHGINVASQHQDEVVTASKDYVINKLELLNQVLLGMKTQGSNVVAEPATVSPCPEITLTGAKSLHEVLKSSKHLMLHFTSEEKRVLGEYDGVVCSPCYNQTNGSNRKNKTGFFGFDRSLGSEFGGSQIGQLNQPTQFRRLKSRIEKHLNKASHLCVVNEQVPITSNEQQLHARNQKIGMALGKVAYKNIVRNQSKSMYEEDVAFLSDITFDVGDKNHGADFVDSIAPFFYSVLKQQTISVLNLAMKYSSEPSPFVIFADKITPNAVTLQIIGIITLQRGRNTALVLDIAPVKNHDGRSIAQDIVNCVLRYFTPEMARKLYMGSSYDGQYLKLNVPDYVLQLLGINYPKILTKFGQAQHFFHTTSWDPAHLIELACADIKKGKNYPWVEAAEQVIISINKKHTYGKSYNNLVEQASQIDSSIQKTVLRPGSFSETRFSAYKYDVLYRFDNNFPSLYNKLASEKDDDFNSLSSVKFCLRLCALEDIFKLIGKTSEKVQSSHIFPWQADAEIENCIFTLERMVESLSSTTDETASQLHKFSNAVREIQDKGSYKDRGIFIQQPVTHSTRRYMSQVVDEVSFTSVILKVRKEVSEYISDIVESIQDRFAKNHEQQAFISARDAFSVERIIRRDVHSVPDSFVQYCTLAKNVGFIQDVSFDDLEKQYTVLTKAVHSLHSKFKQSSSIVDEESLYAKLLTENDDLYEAPYIVILLSSALVRNKSECIAESLGSLIKVHLDKRGSLSNENLANEIILHFNGPAPNQDCDGLIRESLNSRFGVDKWSFIRTSAPSELKKYEKSKVIDKIHKKIGRIHVPNIEHSSKPDGTTLHN